MACLLQLFVVAISCTPLLALQLTHRCCRCWCGAGAPVAGAVRAEPTGASRGGRARCVGSLVPADLLV